MFISFEMSQKKLSNYINVRDASSVTIRIVYPIYLKINWSYSQKQGRFQRDNWNSLSYLFENQFELFSIAGTLTA